MIRIVKGNAGKNGRYWAAADTVMIDAIQNQICVSIDSRR